MYDWLISKRGNPYPPPPYRILAFSPFLFLSPPCAPVWLSPPVLWVCFAPCVDTGPASVSGHRETACILGCQSQEEKSNAIVGLCKQCNGTEFCAMALLHRKIAKKWELGGSRRQCINDHLYCQRDLLRMLLRSRTV